MSQDVIRVEGVSKHFLLPHEKVTSIKSHFTRGFRKHNKAVETYQALRGINFSVKQGEFFGIVGRNGSGKSTLLKLLAKIYQPSEGSVHTIGKLVPFIELGVGFNPELTGRDNVYLNGALLGFSKKEIDQQYADIVSFAELEDFMDQKLKNYSSGMQVRLAFSMATRSKMDILLVDEVLAVGDADFQRKCFNYFKGLKKQGVTVVFVTHNMEAVREYCDRAMLIEDSHLVLEGKPDRVASAYARLFQGESAKTIKEVKKRYGDNSMTFSSPKTTVSDSSVLIKTSVTAKKDVLNPVFGFSVRAPSGLRLMGTNTLILKEKKPGIISAGDSFELEWKIENVFGDAKYSVDISVHAADMITVYDWWEEAVEFEVKRSVHTPYVVQPEMSFKSKSLGAASRKRKNG